MKLLLFGLSLWVTTWSIPLTAAEPIEEFFITVTQADSPKLLEMMHPQLVSRIDPPILESWVQAINYRLGKFESTKNNHNKSESETENFEYIFDGSIQFSRGTAEAKFIWKKEQLIAFELKSDQMINWFQRPASLDLYRQQGQQFLAAFLKNETGACQEIMHEKLSEKLPPEQLKALSLKVVERVGEQPDVAHQAATITVTPEDRVDRLELVYTINKTGESDSEDSTGLTAELTYRFLGMQGHLLGFNFR